MTLYADIGEAVQLLKAGYRVRRQGWGDTGPRFIFYTPMRRFYVMHDTCLGEACPPVAGQEIWRREHISARLADGDLGVWDMTQADLLAQDWMAVDR